MCAPANGRRYEPMPHGACDGRVQGGGGPVKQGNQSRDRSSQGPAVKRTGQSQGVKNGHGIPGVANVESPVPGCSPAEMHRRRMCMVWSLLCVLGMAFRHRTSFFCSAFFPCRSALASARPRRHRFGIVWGLIVPGPSTDAAGLNAAFARLVCSCGKVWTSR